MSYMLSGKEESINKKYFLYFYAGTIFQILIALYIIILPVIELYLGATYTIECKGGNLTMQYWLICQGTLSIIIVFCTIWHHKIKLNIRLKNNIKIFIIMILSFELINLISGSILFWNFCHYLTNGYINIFMYFSIICGFISMVNIILFVNTKEKYTLENPLLPI